MPTSSPTRRCPHCHQNKPLSEFRTRKGADAARRNRLGQPYGACRPCTTLYAARRRSASPADFLACLLHIANRHATLTLADLVALWDRQQGLCAITKLPMTHAHGRGLVHSNASIDRIDPALGYIPSNIQLVRRDVNTAKSNMTLEQLVSLARAIVAANPDLAPPSINS